MSKNSLFGEVHVGRWVRLKLIGGFEVTACIVGVGRQMIEVQEARCDETWHVPDRSIATFQWIAAPGIREVA